MRLIHDFHEHPVTEAIWERSPAALGLYVRMASYCAKHKTGGLFAGHIAASEGTDLEQLVQVLIELGVVERIADGLQLSNFHAPARRRRERLRDAVRTFVIARDGRTCRLCGSEIGPEERLHVDHVIPWSKGGTHDPSNLQVAHATCNLKKGARL